MLNDSCPYATKECFEDGDMDGYCISDEYGECPTEEQREKYNKLYDIGE